MASGSGGEVQSNLKKAYSTVRTAFYNGKGESAVTVESSALKQILLAAAAQLNEKGPQGTEAETAQPDQSSKSRNFPRLLPLLSETMAQKSATGDFLAIAGTLVSVMTVTIGLIYAAAKPPSFEWKWSDCPWSNPDEYTLWVDCNNKSLSCNSDSLVSDGITF
eukprot:s559_g5.t1